MEFFVPTFVPGVIFFPKRCFWKIFPQFSQTHDVFDVQVGRPEGIKNQKKIQDLGNLGSKKKQKKIWKKCTWIIVVKNPGNPQIWECLKAGLEQGDVVGSVTI